MSTTGIAPNAPKLANAVPVAVSPTAGITDNSACRLPGISQVKATTPTLLTIQLPLLSFVDPALPTALKTVHEALITAQLRQHEAMIIPSPGTNKLHLATNYHSAGFSHAILHTLTGSPIAPFAAHPTFLHKHQLMYLRKFTLLVPTHAGWLGDDALRSEQLRAFLFSSTVNNSDDVSGLDLDLDLDLDDKHQYQKDDPMAVQQRWFKAQAREQQEERERWTAVVCLCVKKLAVALGDALLANDEIGEEAREEVCGEIVFQEYCNGWGEKCGADSALVGFVRNTLADMVRLYGSVLRGRIRLRAGAVGAWSDVKEIQDEKPQVERKTEDDESDDDGEFEGLTLVERGGDGLLANGGEVRAGMEA